MSVDTVQESAKSLSQYQSIPVVAHTFLRCRFNFFMFKTHKSAAFPVQFDPNHSLWKWVELAVEAPVFILEIVSCTEDDDIVTHRLTSSIKVLRDHMHPPDRVVLKRVFLLSPGYVNGSAAYQLDALDSVCVSPTNSMNMLFKLTDGRMLYFSLGEDRLEVPNYTEIVFNKQGLSGAQGVVQP